MNEIINTRPQLSFQLPFVEYVRWAGSFPPESILFGRCDDDLPFLFNCNHESSPHVAIENGASILNTVRKYIEIREQDKITVELIHAKRKNINFFLSALIEWTEVRNRNSKVFFLIDDLDSVEVSNEFLWLLENGTKHGIYFVASFRKETEVLSKFRSIIKQAGDGFIAPEGPGTVKFFAL